MEVSVPAFYWQLNKEANISRVFQRGLLLSFLYWAPSNWLRVNVEKTYQAFGKDDFDYLFLSGDRDISPCQYHMLDVLAEKRALEFSTFQVHEHICTVNIEIYFNH